MSNRQEVMGREVAGAHFAKQIRSTKPVVPTDLPPVSADAVNSPKSNRRSPTRENPCLRSPTFYIRLHRMSNAAHLPYPLPLANQPDFGPLARHHRSFRSFPPRTLLGKAGVVIENAFESLLASSSIIPDAPVYDSHTFPWVKEVEADWRLVRAELDQIMTYRDQIPSFHEIIKEVSTITTDHDWKTFFLMGVGMETGENARRCPNTMQVLQKIPGITTAMFSILSPGKHIPPHRGPYAGVLRLHLGLLVPEPREQVRIRIGNQCYAWEEGRCIIFDDTYNHEVWNDTNGYRVVLFVDFQRPMTFPMDILNHWVMNAAALAPFIREAGGKQKAWEQKFYNQPKSPNTGT